MNVTIVDTLSNMSKYANISSSQLLNANQVNYSVTDGINAATAVYTSLSQLGSFSISDTSSNVSQKFNWLETTAATSIAHINLTDQSKLINLTSAQLMASDGSPTLSAAALIYYQKSVIRIINLLLAQPLRAPLTARMLYLCRTHLHCHQIVSFILCPLLIVPRI